MVRGAFRPQAALKIMSEEKSHWIEYLDNKVALFNAFGGKSPGLNRMLLAQVILGQTGDFRVSLNFPELPEHSPTRWIANGNDSVQLRLSFHDVTRLSIEGGAHEGNLDVVASFEPHGHFLITSQLFNVDLTYGHVKADLYPFNSSVFEEPRDWYHR